MEKPPSAPRDVYGMIRALIVAGDYLGGDPMPEEELAARLEVSRTPVREALKRLQAEGFVEKRANRRIFLAELHPSTVVEIFVVRARLEPLAARLAASRVDSAFLTLLQDCIDRMKDILRQVEPDRGNLRHDRRPLWIIADPSWHIDDVGGRSHHQCRQPT